MQYGISLPNFGPGARDGLMVEIAKQAESLGFDSVWVSDHVIIPTSITSRYPYTSTGEFPLASTEDYFEPIAAAGFLAGATSRIRLGFSILVLPYRQPILAAKMLATLDVLSQGRLIVGVGAGWMAEEFSLLGVPFEDRGPRTTETIQVFKDLWTRDRPSFQGSIFQVDSVGFYPKPTQKPYPPIWVGGHSEAAMRRAARFGDGWHAARSTPEQMKEELDRLRPLLEAEGRQLEKFSVTLRRSMRISATGGSATDESRSPLLGTIEEVAADIRAYAEIGVKHLIFEFYPIERKHIFEQMKLFVKKVRPLVEEPPTEPSEE